MEERSRFFYALSLVLQLGFSMALPLVVGIGGGVWLDQKFNTSPRLTLLGIVLGLIVSGYSFYYEVLPLITKDKKDKKENHE